MDWVARYVGIPFADDGLDLRGCHCWGLVRLVLATERGLALPAYGETSARELVAAARLMAGESARAPWRRVQGDPAGWRPFDVVLMRAAGRRVPDHVGIVGAPGHLLHVERASAAVHVPLSHMSVRHRLIAAFRHEALA